jgi:hypothetical protein
MFHDSIVHNVWDAANRKSNWNEVIMTTLKRVDS